MSTFGNRPDDVIQDRQGNAQSGVLVLCYATQADATNQTNLLTSATSGEDGRWPVTLNGYDSVWARDPKGNVWPVDAADAITSHGTRLTNLETSVAGKVTKGDIVVSVRDYGAKGDGATDDSSAISSAITAAGAGGTVVFPKGAFGNASFVWGPTTGVPALPVGQRWLGGGIAEGNGSGASYAKCEIVFPNLVSGQKAVSASTTCAFDQIHFRGPGVNVSGVIGPSNAGSVNAIVFFNECQFYDWDTGSQLDASYYSKFESCEWRHNNLDLNLVNVCYNVNIYHCRFDGSGANIVGNTTPTYGTCIKADAVNGLNIFGGSIESYGSRVDVAKQAGILITNTTTRSAIHLNGVYFETACDKGTGWDITGCTGVTLTWVGGSVGLNNHGNFGSFTGTTNCVVFIRGVNVFGTDPSSTAPNFLAPPLTNPANIVVDYDSISWQVSITGATFDNAALGVGSPGVRGSYPSNYAGSGSSNHNRYWNVGNGVRIPDGRFLKNGVTTTAARPSGTGAGLLAGAQMFDSTLGKPIWYDGSAWHDAAGNLV